MKRYLTIIGVLVLAGAVIFPLMAFSHGWRYGHQMMGYWGNESEYGRGAYGNVTAEQETKLEALDRKFNDETKDLMDKIWTKSRELDSVLNSSTPDFEKAKALQNEISDLRANLDEKTLTYELESRKIVPDQRLGYSHGGWDGHHMRTYGHMTGYGPGYCWN